jgi:hypothetical protein
MVSISRIRLCGTEGWRVRLPHLDHLRGVPHLVLEERLLVSISPSRTVNKIYFQMYMAYPIWQFICVTLSRFSYSGKLEDVTLVPKQRTSALYCTTLAGAADGSLPPRT